MIVFRITFIASAICLLMSCKQDKIEEVIEDCPDVISFSQDVQPLINTNCSTSGCHAAGFISPTLLTHADIEANADNILIRIQKDPTDGQLMPSGGPKLADSFIQQIKCWKDQGKLDN
jgi:hypothetical protein